MAGRKVDPKLARQIEADMAEIDGTAVEEVRKTVQVEATPETKDGICPTCQNTGLDGEGASAAICPTCNGEGGGERSEVTVDRQDGAEG